MARPAGPPIWQVMRSHLQLSVPKIEPETAAFVPRCGSVKVTGLAQKLRQLEAIHRDMHSKYWAILIEKATAMTAIAVEGQPRNSQWQRGMTASPLAVRLSAPHHADRLEVSAPMLQLS